MTIVSIVQAQTSLSEAKSAFQNKDIQKALIKINEAADDTKINTSYDYWEAKGIIYYAKFKANKEADFDISTLHVDTNSNVGHLKTELREVLENEFVVIYKEQAKNGFDLHLFSKKNIYTKFFFPLQSMLPDAFRFFSINGKKFRSERHFYFETWTLARPPHGFEEVFPESVL